MKRTLRIGASIALVIAAFFFGLPKIADLSEVRTEIGAMSWVEVAVLIAIALWNIVAYWFVMMASLPGSDIWQSMKVNGASTAVANILPGGGALGIGVTYGMYGGYGFTRSEVSLSILITGIWNAFVKLGMPIAALALVAVENDVGPGLLLASLIGLIFLLVSVGAFIAILASDRLALAVGARLERIVSGLKRMFRKPPATGLAAATVTFRHDAIGLVKHSWLSLTTATLVSHLALFAVLLIALRNVGVEAEEVAWAEALAAFAFVRLLTALPITPGGLGVIELGLSAALVAAGGPEAQVVAAVLVFRALTYLLPMPIGLGMYLSWKGSGPRRRKLEDAAS